MAWGYLSWALPALPVVQGGRVGVEGLVGDHVGALYVINGLDPGDGS